MSISTGGTKYYYTFPAKFDTFVEALDICNKLYLIHQELIDSFLFDRGIGIAPTISHDPGPIGIYVSIDVQVEREIREQFLIDISADIQRVLEIHRLNYGDEDNL